MLLHLFYKARVELSTDRVEFLSRLFARPQPTDAGHDSGVDALFGAFNAVSASRDTAQATLLAVFDRLERLHGFPLSREDEDGIRKLYESFVLDGPAIR